MTPKCDTCDHAWHGLPCEAKVRDRDIPSLAVPCECVGPYGQEGA